MAPWPRKSARRVTKGLHSTLVDQAEDLRRLEVGVLCPREGGALRRTEVGDHRHPNALDLRRLEDGVRSGTKSGVRHMKDGDILCMNGGAQEVHPFQSNGGTHHQTDGGLGAFLLFLLTGILEGHHPVGDATQKTGHLDWIQIGD